MKQFILAAVVMSSAVPAFADVRACTRATKTLTSVINGYIDLIHSCRNSQGTSSYYQYQNLARDTETLYKRAQANCSQACSFDSFSQKLCWNVRDLEGACP